MEVPQKMEGWIKFKLGAFIGAVEQRSGPGSVFHLARCFIVVVVVDALQ